MIKYECQKEGNGEWFIYSSARPTAIPKEFFRISEDGGQTYNLEIKIDEAMRDNASDDLDSNLVCAIQEDSKDLFDKLIANMDAAMNQA